MTPRTDEEWARRVAAEYRSAALTAQIVHGLIVAAVPEAVVQEGLRVVADELAHARLCHDCRIALGGPDTPSPLTPEDLVATPSESLLAGLVDSVVVNLCIGETLAVPLFAAMRRHTRHPAALQVLDRITADEARHRQFAWDVLDALLALDPSGIRARAQTRLPAWVADLRERYAHAQPGMPLTEEERAAGLLPVETYAEIVRQTLGGELRRRFAKRDIDLPTRP